MSIDRPVRSLSCSLLSHASDIDDFLKGLDGVLEDGLHGLHNAESSFHVIDLWLHSFNRFHFSRDLDQWLTVV